MYKFVEVISLYQKAIDSWKELNQDYANYSYLQAKEKLNYQGYGWGDFYEVELTKIGVEATQLFPNVNFLQEKWAVENNAPYSGLELLIFQLQSLKPDVVLFEDSHIYGGEVLATIKEKVPSIKYCIGFNCAPYSAEGMRGFKAFDVMLTCTPGFEQDMSNAGINSKLINHAFHPDILNRLKPRQELYDVTFIGGIFLGASFHNQRKKLIESLINVNIDLSIFGYLNEPKSLKRKMVNFLLPDRGYSQKLKQKVQSPLFGLDMYQAILNSNMVLNNHIDAVGNYAGNMRLFEATGVGACLLTDKKQNLHKLFKIDEEVVVYDSVDECIEKINWLNNHPEERERIAKAGQQRTLKDHTFTNRSQELHELILKQLGR